MAAISVGMAVVIGLIGFLAVPPGNPLQPALMVVSLINLAIATYFVLIEARHMKPKK